jgi:hypothetical protein
MACRWQRGLVAPLTASFIVAPGCVRTDDRRDATVELDTDESKARLAVVRQDGLTLESLVYEPTRWPLEDFVAHLSLGRFRESMQSFDPRFHGTTSENEAIAALLDAGLIPVYVRVSSDRPEATWIAEGDLELSDGARSYELIPAAALPKEIERLNPKAVGANVVNVAVVVGATVILVAALAKGGGGGGLGNPFGGVGSGGGKRHTERKEAPRVINPVMQTVTIDYRDFLLRQGFVDAKGVREGLVFFRAGTRPMWTKLRLTRRRP